MSNAGPSFHVSRVDHKAKENEIIYLGITTSEQIAVQGIITRDHYYVPHGVLEWVNVGNAAETEWHWTGTRTGGTVIGREEVQVKEGGH